MDKKTANRKQSHVLWVDLEMTGLDPLKDKIMEVGAIITDWNFKELATLEAPVKVTPRIITQRMSHGPSAAFWKSVPDSFNALVANNRTAAASKTVENQLLQFIDQYFSAEQLIILAGNSIHMDRQFINTQWPRLAKRLHYRMLDVTAWKLVFEHKFKKKYAKRVAHRALDDIRGSIEELQYYLKRR